MDDDIQVNNVLIMLKRWGGYNIGGFFSFLGVGEFEFVFLL
jgi:hypothetical protein